MTTILHGTRHVPVLAHAVLALAAVRTGEIWVDCTVGFAGHARQLLDAGARVYGVDQDGEALASAAEALASYGGRAALLRGNFRDVGRLLDDAGVGPVDGFLADVGVSSHQLDAAARGFSFQAAGPLDMRMSGAGETAAELVARLDEAALTGILRTYGEEPFAGRVARAMKQYVAEPGPHDTVGLADAIARALPQKARHARKRHPATRAFQALRIAVNDELGALEALLETIPERLAPGGRALVISFHSLEDRLVKKTFARWSGKSAAPVRRGLPPPPSEAPAFELLTRRPVVADEAELAENPRARSAKLRAVRKVAA